MLFLCLANESIAALPPFYQSKKEIEAILSSQEIPKYIPSGDLIIQISKTDDGYLIITNHRVVAVSIHYLKEKHLGPGRFHIEFHDPSPLGATSSKNKKDEL